MDNSLRINGRRFLYRKGDRVELVYMQSIVAPPIGTIGTVTKTDSAGRVFVNWDKFGPLEVKLTDAIRKII